MLTQPSRPEPTSTVADPKFPTDQLAVTAWPDPVIDELGHDPRSAYVEHFWLGILGPSTVWLLRRLADGLEREPDGFVLDLPDTARALGVGMRGGRQSPFMRSLERVCRFGAARWQSPTELAVRRRLPPLTRAPARAAARRPSRPSTGTGPSRAPPRSTPRSCGSGPSSSPSACSSSGRIPPRPNASCTGGASTRPWPTPRSRGPSSSTARAAAATA